MAKTSRRELLRGSVAVALNSILARNALAVGPVNQPAQAALEAVAPRERLLLDFGWKFVPGHANDPLRDLGFGATQGDFAKTRNFAFALE